MLRNVILAVGWPILVIGSIFILIQGISVYRLVKGSLVGKLTQILVLTMLVEMYSLGIVSTVLMFCDVNGVYWVLPVFAAWFVMFVLTLMGLRKAVKEAKQLAGPTPPAEK